jgi:tetratricopeptide (TPR) repeat protein
LDIEVASHGKDSNTNISKILGHIGLVHEHHENYELALENFQHALSIEQRLLPSQHIYIALRFENIGSCYLRRTNFQLALQYFQQALTIIERILPLDHRHHVLTLKGIVDSLEHLGDYKQAIEFAIRKLDHDPAIYKGWTMACLSELHLKLNDLSKAYQYFQDASTFYEKNQSDNSSAITKLEKKLKTLEQSFLTISDK